MLDLRLGFIGGGAMAAAITAGLVAQKAADPGSIYISDHKAPRCAVLEKKYGVRASVGKSFVRDTDVVILAVKPQVIKAAVAEVQPLLKDGALVISIVAGLTLKDLESFFPGHAVIRVMPNTPLAVGAGMSAYACGSAVTERDASIADAIFAASGFAIHVDEHVMDAVTGLSGSGPAYAFLMIDALADGGVAAGLKRPYAIQMAAQTLLGAAKMVLEQGRHPDVLRDQVTSPGGTTIAGVRVLEQRGVRGALIDAVLAATEKSAELGKK